MMCWEARMQNRFMGRGRFVLTRRLRGGSRIVFTRIKSSRLGKPHSHLSAYLERLQQRPSFARVLKEAEPYFYMFPYKRLRPAPRILGAA